MRQVVLSMMLFFAGCAYAPHVADSTLTSAVIATGGTELNPIGFPAVVVAKIGGEAVAEKYRRDGNRIMCYEVAGAIRWGSWIGFGATVGGLVGGPVGMIALGVMGASAGYTPAYSSAASTCWRTEDGPGDPDVRTVETIGFNSR